MAKMKANYQHPKREVWHVDPKIETTTKEKNMKDLMKWDRPIEPNNSEEDPEAWFSVACWEEERADKAEEKAKELQAEKKALLKVISEGTTLARFDDEDGFFLSLEVLVAEEIFERAKRENNDAQI